MGTGPSNKAIDLKNVQGTPIFPAGYDAETALRDLVAVGENARRHELRDAFARARAFLAVDRG